MTSTATMEPLLDPSLVNEVLGEALSYGGSFAEVFVEDVARSSAGLDDGRIENLASSRDKGVGIRVATDGSTGFAHTSNLSRSALMAAASVAGKGVNRAAGRQETAQPPALGDARQFGSAIEVSPGDTPKHQKVDLLHRANEIAREAGDQITQVSAHYADSRRRIMVVNSDGVFATDDQTRTMFSVGCVATGDGLMQTGRETVGHTVGFELFNQYDVEELARKAAAQATLKLRARPAPSGTFQVVIGPGSGGVMFHEACGHGLEADLVKKGASAFAGKVGQPVASELVTLIDDSTVAKEWGTFSIDDEGQIGRRNVLIENGILVDYMWDVLRAREDDRQSSGNGRRQSYRHLPMVRMSNTYLTGGTSTPDEIIATVDYGVYVANLGGGQVNTASGDFVFGMVEAYMIEDGKITTPLQEGQLIGNGPKVLQMIEAVGNDFEMGPPGTCGKDGQGVPVGDGVPTLKVAELTIGGTAG